MFARDRNLLERFRDGEEKVLAEIYRAHLDEVIRVARGALRACAAGRIDELAGDLADVVQETFAKAFAPEARRRFDPERSYAPYLVQIARNVAIDYWRARRRQVSIDVDQLVEKLSLETTDDRADWADVETVAIVERYLASLDPGERRIHDALYVKGLSQREAALELGIGRQVVRTVEAKLRTGLRRELAQAGHREGSAQTLTLAAGRTGAG